MIPFAYMLICKELSGSVVECSVQGVTDSSITGSTVMRLLARHFILCLARIQPRKRPDMTEKLLTGMGPESITFDYLWRKVNSARPRGHELQ